MGQVRVYRPIARGARRGRRGNSSLAILAASVCLVRWEPRAQAAGAIDFWTAGSGDWSNSANWNSGAGPVPGSGDTAYISNADTINRTITYSISTNTTTLTSVEVANTASGTTTLSCTSATAKLWTQREDIGTSNVATSTGVITFSAGLNNVSNTLGIGDTANDTGTYNLSGTASLFVSGVGGTSTEFVGAGGTGTFNQSGGTHISEDHGIYIGYAPNSTGDYNLSGGGRSTHPANSWARAEPEPSRRPAARTSSSLAPRPSSSVTRPARSEPILSAAPA
jgi:hypothetical protein